MSTKTDSAAPSSGGNNANQSGAEKVSAATSADQGAPAAPKSPVVDAAVSSASKTSAPKGPASARLVAAEAAAAKVAQSNAAEREAEKLQQISEDSAEKSEKDKDDLLAEADSKAESEDAALVVNAPDLAAGLSVADVTVAGLPQREAVEGGSAVGDDDDSNGTGIVLGIGALALLGGGVAIAAGGGGGTKQAELPSNVAPVAGDDSFTVAEGSGVFSGTVAGNDSDADGDSLTYALSGSAPAGLTFNANGSFDFDANLADFNSLNVGQTQGVTFSYTVSDGNGASDTASVTITVTGTNDAPVAVADVNTATEDGALATGSVAANDSDVDNGAVLTYALNAPVAGLTLGTDGAYSFDPSDAAYQSLALGETTDVVATYTVTDENGATATSTLTITVTGTNDAPVAVADVNTATEDGALATGSVAANDSDVDNGAVLTYALNAPVAGLTLGTDGAYSFDPSDAAYQSLALGETTDVVATYTVTDENGATATSTLTITVTGTNDAPVAVADVNTATEDGALATGSVAANDSDVDNGAVLTYALNAPVAGLTLGTDGAYSFDPSDAAYQSLALGETTDVVATYTVTDENGATATSTLTITVTGTNDAPVAVADVNTATEDGALATGSVAANDSDVDNGAVLTYALNAPVAGLTLGTDGAYSFDPSDAAYQSLALGETTDVVATYTVTDENGATATSTLTITVTGTNDAPVAVADVNTATEDGALATGSVAANDSDVDNGAVLTYALNAPVAGLTLGTDGAYSFDPSDAAYQSLALGETTDVVATYTVTDENGATATSTLTITVTGTNDAPVAVADVNTATEDGALATGSVAANDSDVDNGAVLTYALNAPVAGLTLGTDGAYSFDPSDAAYQSLALGETTDVVATYTVTDENGATATSTLTITVTGTNDAPVAVADVNTATEDGALATGSVAANDSDVDNGAVLTYALNAPVAGLTLGTDGAYSFDPSDAAYQSLALGETTDVVATYTVTDENGATATSTLTITVTGTNDAPTVDGALVAAAAEDDTAFSINMLEGAADVDNGAVLSVDNVTGVEAGVVFSGTTLTVDPGADAFQSLALGETKVITVSYDVVDENGGSVAQTATITITGTNDAPFITSGATGSVSENAAVSTVVYDADATDVDASDTISYAISGADAAALTIDSVTGEVRLIESANFERQTSYSFTVTATDSVSPALSDTQAVTLSVIDEIDVLSIDGIGQTQAPVTISAGIQAGDVTDTNFQFTETSGIQTEVNITNFGSNDFILFDGFDPSDYTFQNDGNGNLVISRLDDDGFTTNVITLVGVTEGNNALVVTEADAEAALASLLGAGDYFRGTADPVTVETTGTDTFNAAGAKVTFIEDLAGPESLIIIDNFRADDVIQFLNGDIGEVSFGSDPGDPRDLRIDYFDFATGQASTIILNDVLDPDGPLIFDEASAEAALAAQLGQGDYFQFG